MTVDEIINIVSNVGFPIAICVALFYQLIKTNEMVWEFQKTIDENTAITKRLVDLIERDHQNNKAG